MTGSREFDPHSSNSMLQLQSELVQCAWCRCWRRRLHSIAAYFAIQGPCALATHSALLRYRDASELAQHWTNLHYPITSCSSSIPLLLCLWPHLASAFRLDHAPTLVYIHVLLRGRYYCRSCVTMHTDPTSPPLAFEIRLCYHYPFASCLIALRLQMPLASSCAAPCLPFPSQIKLQTSITNTPLLHPASWLSFFPPHYGTKCSRLL